MTEQSTDGIDREGIGMLYAAGAGMMIGTSVAYGTDPVFGWVGGSLAIALGLAYEVHQRSLHTETQKEADR